MIRWEVEEGYLLPVLESAHHRTLAVKVCKVIFTERYIDVETLLAKLSSERDLSRDEKLFVKKYVKKLAAYKMLEEHNGWIKAKAEAFPVKLLRIIVEAKENELEKYFSKRTLRAWKKGERLPDIRKLAEVL